MASSTMDKIERPRLQHANSFTFGQIPHARNQRSKSDVSGVLQMQLGERGSPPLTGKDDSVLDPSFVEGESVSESFEHHRHSIPNEFVGERIKMPSIAEKTLPKGDKSDKDNIKARKKTYKKEKKRAAEEFSHSLKDSSVVILSSWLKIRGTLKAWAKFWCVVRPGLLVIYKSNKHEHWVGTVLLNTCEVIERPSSKEGYCFKFFHPLHESIWTTKGPKGEIAGALAIPMPKDHLILRAPSESIGRCWMDAIEVAQRSSFVHGEKGLHSDLYGAHDRSQLHPDGETEGGEQDEESFVAEKSDDMSSAEENEGEETFRVFTCATEDEPIVETPYVEGPMEYLGEAGEAAEEMEEENKSILWSLLKQVRPGMDLSKVTLPTFILEPRSFLDKLADYYYHCDILTKAAAEESPYQRMKEVVRWYLSGFYKKPKGLKKPYNPVIGEMFRCVWPNNANDSRTFFLAEQVSHHPPVSAFYCSNRKDGYAVSGSILAKSKFYGNSTSAILDGTATVTFLKLGEDYAVNMPYAHIKGILIGSLTAELGGTVNITCEKTGYHANIEFKLKPFWKKSAESNRVVGKIRMGNDVLSKIEGKWDGEILMTEFLKGDEQVEDPLPEIFFDPSPEVKRTRLRRHNVDFKSQEMFESERLWSQVTVALKQADQENATKEKFALEEDQRNTHRELKEKQEEWVPRFFERDHLSTNPHAWVYKYRDLRPWDPCTDLLQYEHKGVIKTKTRHVTPNVQRTGSLPNISVVTSNSGNDVRDPNLRLPTIIEPSESDMGSRQESIEFDSNAPNSSDDDSIPRRERSNSSGVLFRTIETSVKAISESQSEQKQLLLNVRSDIRRLKTTIENSSGLQIRDWLIIGVLLLAQVLLQHFLNKRR